MKVAVCKIGSRISVGGTSGGSGESMSICKMLAKGGIETHVYTKIIAKDILSEEFKWHQIMEDADNINEPGYDALIVINGSVNYVGGAPQDDTTINYMMINKFKGPVFYIYCDPNLILKQIWKMVEAKLPGWKEKYNSRMWTEDEINITRDDIYVICQSYNTEYVASQFAKVNVPICGVSNYAFDKFPLLQKQAPLLYDPSIDLSYGGTLRTGRREKKLIDFYWGYPDDISVEVFGKIKHEQFNPKKIADLRAPTFTGAVNYDKMISKMSEAMAHVVIGDDMYKKFRIMSQRSYESVLAGCITFIDIDLDETKIMYGANKGLAEFLYVKDRAEVIDKIRYAKSQGSEFGREMANATLEHFDFNAKEYCTGFAELIKSKI